MTILAAGDFSGGSGGGAAAVLNPPVLFFFLGMVAALVRSNLRVPPAVTKLLALYLLWAIGFRGGVELSHGLPEGALMALGAAMLLAAVVPVYTFFILRPRVGVPNAAALAAAYGSISAVTFVTAAAVLDSLQISYGGHMVAAMALMESPAIVIGVLLMRVFYRPEEDPAAAGAAGSLACPRQPLRWGKLLHEAFLNGPVVLLLGSLLIGIITGDQGYAAFKPLATDLFSGVLAFFLLDLGLVSARRMKSLRNGGVFLVAFGIIVPVVNAMAGIGLAYWIGMPRGDAVLLAVLAASASYIAVPAAVRVAIPQADPGLYLPLALGVTFPFNVLVGIPLYMGVVGALWR